LKKDPAVVGKLSPVTPKGILCQAQCDSDRVLKQAIDHSTFLAPSLKEGVKPEGELFAHNSLRTPFDFIMPHQPCCPQLYFPPNKTSCKSYFSLKST